MYYTSYLNTSYLKLYLFCKKKIYTSPRKSCIEENRQQFWKKICVKESFYEKAIKYF